MISLRKPPAQHRADRVRRAWVVVAALLLAGCAAPPPRPAPSVVAVPAAHGPIAARDDDFAVIVVAKGEDLPALAARFLGDPAKSWQIAEFNGIDRVRAGQTVVIPLRPHNIGGVHAGGFQTVPILCYHRFGPRSSKLTVSRAAFEAQMDYLAHNGYHVVPLAQLRAFLDGKEPLPQKTVAITIDDGYRSTYEIAYPVLRKHGFVATVFLYSDFVGATDALTWPQMKEMIASRLIEIQPHSKTHANLTLRLPAEGDAKYRERIKREVEVPVRLIKDRLGEASTTYAYPYGDVNDTVVHELARLEIAMGVTVTPGGNGFFADPYLLRRSMVFGNDDLDSFRSKLTTFARTAVR